MPQINITNIEKVSSGQYKVYFNSDFEIIDLFFEVSTNGTTWNSPTAMGNTSPQTIPVTNLLDFYVRLSTDYITPIPPETGFLMININDKFLTNDTDSLKYTN